MNETSTQENSISMTPELIGIFVNLAISVLMMLERIFTKTKKSECTASASGVSVKVDNSKDVP